ncbi:3TM-type holin [Halomonas smyrnensis]|uniref:3TM-type holin n=1 Tax=Halomonas smyrnensis TaxID=720605 RepID=UPI00036CE52E|nr:3TM-type holin [Halomonas smyrnensis]
MMDWKDAVTEIAKYAPAVATAIGGPSAGGVTAGAARMVTSALGVEDSPAGLVAATQDEEKRAELIRLNNEHRRELEKMRIDAEAADAAEKTARLVETQKTMRAELQADGWFKSGWRPGLGWIFCGSLGSIAGVLAYTIAQDPTVVTDPEFSGMLVWIVGTMGAALGINVRERSKDKARQAGQRPASFLNSLSSIRSHW